MKSTRENVFILCCFTNHKIFHLFHSEQCKDQDEMDLSFKGVELYIVEADTIDEADLEALGNNTSIFRKFVVNAVVMDSTRLLVAREASTYFAFTEVGSNTAKFLEGNDGSPSPVENGTDLTPVLKGINVASVIIAVQTADGQEPEDGTVDEAVAMVAASLTFKVCGKLMQKFVFSLNFVIFIS